MRFSFRATLSWPFDFLVAFHLLSSGSISQPLSLSPFSSGSCKHSESQQITLFGRSAHFIHSFFWLADFQMFKVVWHRLQAVACLFGLIIMIWSWGDRTRCQTLLALVSLIDDSSVSRHLGQRGPPPAWRPVGALRWRHADLRGPVGSGEPRVLLPLPEGQSSPAGLRCHHNSEGNILNLFSPEMEPTQSYI